MASYTGNLNLKKPALDDDALITDINNNMDILDASVNGIQDGLAIVANGNTHVAITAGQFVYVRNHGTLTEGLYVASTNIAANATLSTSNLTADAAGGLNALNSKIENSIIFGSLSAGVTYTTPSLINGSMIFIWWGGDTSAILMKTNSNRARTIYNTLEDFTISCDNNVVSISNTKSSGNGNIAIIQKYS